jgi:hypothetical protein
MLLEKPNRALLTINTIRDVDDGNFTCTVANGIGAESTSDTMRLMVRRPPAVLAASVLKAAEDSNEARSAKFECIAEAYPDISFKWKLPVFYFIYLLFSWFFQNIGSDYV